MNMHFTGTAISDVGIAKKVNQDSLTLKIAHTDWGEVSLAVMCDGLGGLEQGEVASASVVRAFDQWLKEVFPYRNEIWTAQKIEEDWRQLLTSINQEIYEYGKEKRIELGTTVTAILFLRDRYYVIHVGDCRLYEIGNGIRQLTKDQTVVAMEVEKGILTPEEAKTDKRKNILLQCIGISEAVMPDFFSGETKEGSVYLICSDGFRHEISEEEICRTGSPQKNMTQERMRQNLEYLVDLNKERGEHDNISAIMIRVG